MFLELSAEHQAVNQFTASSVVHCLVLHGSAYRFWWGPRELTVLWARTKQQDVPNALGTEGSMGAHKTKYT